MAKDREWVKRAFWFYSCFWFALAFGVESRQDWFVENILVFIGFPILLRFWFLQKFSNSFYFQTLAFLFFHTIGSHYTYSKVPYDAWLSDLFGWSPQAHLGWERNHYDRLVHFLFGLLLVSPMGEILRSRTRVSFKKSLFLSGFILFAAGSTFELLEWGAAEVFSPQLAADYVGMQGDFWDAQKDQAMAGIGLILGALFLSKRSKNSNHPN